MPADVRELVILSDRLDYQLRQLCDVLSDITASGREIPEPIRIAIYGIYNDLGLTSDELGGILQSLDDVR